MINNQIVVNALAELRQLQGMVPRLAAQLRECAETLGADQIDEMRASRAYADAMALLAEMSHISRTDRGDASLKEQ
ncbi:hypothetical protein [Achromobacter insolitus]|uniref:hypothetical protein n=1 Tax=Achromobacter insolitus TaxID=217204 RepID=UPI002FE056CC